MELILVLGMCSPRRLCFGGSDGPAICNKDYVTMFMGIYKMSVFTSTTC